MTMPVMPVGPFRIWPTLDPRCDGVGPGHDEGLLQTYMSGNLKARQALDVLHHCCSKNLATAMRGKSSSLSRLLVNVAIRKILKEGGLMFLEPNAAVCMATRSRLGSQKPLQSIQLSRPD